MSAAQRAHRGTIALEDAAVLSHTHLAGNQHVLRLHAPRCAAGAVPGSFVHLRCSGGLPMRRPMSILRASATEGWVELLYKVVGAGSRALAAVQTGQVLSVLGPIGRGFTPHRERARVLALGGGVGIPPMIFLAERLTALAAAGSATEAEAQAEAEAPRRADAGTVWRPLVLMGSELPFPFPVRPSKILVPGMPDEAIGCMPLLDEIGVPSRLASLSGFAGCFEGYVTDLARAWLSGLDAAALAQVELFACGPTPMLAAAAHVAREFGLPCQVSLEEFMACAVGGCAGCAVAVHTEGGVAMKRVCVDGPVFEAQSVFG